MYFSFYILCKKTMTKKTFFLWLSDKDSKLQIIGTVQAYKLAMNLVWEYFGGGTIHQWQGFFKHDDGTIVIENTLIIETITDKEHGAFVKQLKKLFNQESILVEINNPSVAFE